MHDHRRCCDAFLDPGRAARQWTPRALGWEAGEVGDDGVGKVGGEESVCGAREGKDG